MEKCQYGNTDMQVTPIGFGAAEIGFEYTDAMNDQVGRLLNSVLDSGVNFIDTAECYTDSEAHIGKHIGHRRGEYYLATKVGHKVISDAGDEWSAELVAATIDRSLERLRTDCVDLIHIHSCPREVLERGEVVSALQRAQSQGKTRYIGYSGDNEAALYAVELGVFDSLEASFSVCDQGARCGLLDAAVKSGLGIIAKRPMANAVLARDRVTNPYQQVYWDRAHQIAWPETGLHPIELSIRFTLSFPVTIAIAGSKHPDRFRQTLDFAGKGALPAHLVDAIVAAYDAAEDNWRQEI